MDPVRTAALPEGRHPAPDRGGGSGPSYGGHWVAPSSEGMGPDVDGRTHAGLGVPDPRGPGVPLTLVLDANVVLTAAAREGGFEPFGNEELVAPPLMWPEARSTLHVALWRGVVSEEIARQSLSIIESGPVRERRHKRLGAEAWRIADDLGWSKTYDAEYLALASILGAAVVTFDRRMRGAAQRLGLAADVP